MHSLVSAEWDDSLINCQSRSNSFIQHDKETSCQQCIRSWEEVWQALLKYGSHLPLSFTQSATRLVNLQWLWLQFKMTSLSLLPSRSCDPYLPNRLRAGSILFGRLVAAMMITWLRCFSPSIRVSSWDTIRRSTSPWVWWCVCTCVRVCVCVCA